MTDRDYSCRHCGNLLTPHVNWSASDTKRKNYRCRPCATAETMKYYELNKEAIKARMRSYINARRAKARAAKLLSPPNK